MIGKCIKRKMQKKGGGVKEEERGGMGREEEGEREYEYTSARWFLFSDIGH